MPKRVWDMPSADDLDGTMRVLAFLLRLPPGARIQTDDRAGLLQQIVDWVRPGDGIVIQRPKGTA